MIRTVTILLSIVVVLAGCAATIRHPAGTAVDPPKLDQTPPEFHAPAVAMDWTMIAGVAGVAVGIGLLVYLPIEKTLGLSIASGSAVAIVAAACTRLALAHPVVLWCLIGVCVAGLIWYFYETYLSGEIKQPTPIVP